MPASGLVAYRRAVREIRQAGWPRERGWPREGGGWPREGGWPRRRGPGVGLAVIVGFIQVVAARRAGADQAAPTPLDALGYALLLAGPAGLLVRRMAPVWVLAVAVAAAVAYPLLGYPQTPLTFLAAAVALFTAVLAGHRYAAWVISAAGYLAYVGLDPLFPAAGMHGPGVGRAVAVGAALVVVVFFAEAARVRREQFAQLARVRAEQARTRTEQRRRQESEERLRIAQELHDVLGHHLSLINVQAGVGLHLMDTRPEQAREALAAIKAASAEALREVRSVLGVLRTDQAAPRSPAPAWSGCPS
jgi:signal transduction histidine kinase